VVGDIGQSLLNGIVAELAADLIAEAQGQSDAQMPAGTFGVFATRGKCALRMHPGMRILTAPRSAR